MSSMQCHRPCEQKPHSANKHQIDAHGHEICTHTAHGDHQDGPQTRGPIFDAIKGVVYITGKIIKNTKGSRKPRGMRGNNNSDSDGGSSSSDSESDSDKPKSKNY